MESLLSAPIKLTTEVDQLTPGKENTILGRAIQTLGINSPSTTSPRTPKSSKAPWTSSRTVFSSGGALTPVNSKKRLRQLSLVEDESDENGPENKKLCPTPPEATSIKSALSTLSATSGTPKFYRSQSESAVTEMIKDALDQKQNNPLLVGDCSRQYTLPFLTVGRNNDLKQISAETLVRLLDGEFKIPYTIIDCRYPYEYAGGHIRDSINLYTETQVHRKYFPATTEPQDKPAEILVFHCEFSAERGPRMCRHMRNWDRTINLNIFPSLFYPELYVLHLGYKGFFELYPTYCTPPQYTKMIEQPQDLKFYRNQCKTELVQPKSKSVPTISGGNRTISVKKCII